MVRYVRLLLGIGFAFVVLAFAGARPARADILSSCGNIDVQASEMCTLQTSGGCMASCTPINFQASCAAQLETTCSGSCTATATATCTGSCSGNCVSNCMANQGSFSCQGSCEADCDTSCSGQCSGMAMGSMAQGQCQASCKASCGGHCQAQCMGTPPSASCTAQCQASCQGSCNAQANLMCDINCQTMGYASCETSLMGGCTAQCSQPNGALFCNGQYVDTGNNLQNCINDLKSALNIQVMGSAMGSCSGSQCTGQAQGSAKCSASPGNHGGGLAIGFGVLGFAGIGMARRRRRGRAS
jgi:MYXO-CTERM domain-containing protein